MVLVWSLGFGAWNVALCGQAAAQEPTNGYAAVQRAFLREDFDGVASLAPAFLHEHPDAPERARAWLWLALSLDRLTRPQEAFAQLDALKAALQPDDAMWPETLFWEGEISRRSSQMVRAYLAYQRLLRDYPDSPWAVHAQMGLGFVYLHHHLYDVALQRFREVAMRREGLPLARDATLLLGVCELRLKRLSEAAEVFGSLLSQLDEPAEIAQAAFYLGESFTALGRYADAARAYRLAIDAGGSPRVVSGAASAASPQWGGPAQFGLGWAEYQLGRCGESVEAMERYLTRPDAGERRTEALFAQGSCLMRLGREREALPRLEEIVSRDAGHVFALESGLVVSEAYQRQGRFESAEEILRALMERHPEPAASAPLRLSLGAVALAQGRAEHAERLLRQAAESDQPWIHQAALNGLGDVRMFLGRYAEAVRFYEEALSAAGKASAAAYAAYRLGCARLQLGELDAAIGILQPLADRADSALADDAGLSLAVAYLNQRDHDAARELLGVLRHRRTAGLPAAAQAGVTSGRAAYYEALLALSEDDEARAEGLCQEAVEDAPRSDEAFEARVLQVELRGRGRPPRDIREELEALFATGPLPRTHRARLAKRLGDLARLDQDYAAAISRYEEAASLLPSLEGETAYRAASCYEEGADVEEAMRWYQQIEQPPWRVRGLLAAAKLLERQDRPAEAAAIYRRLATEPIPEAKVSQERLAALQATDGDAEADIGRRRQ